MSRMKRVAEYVRAYHADDDERTTELLGEMTATEVARAIVLLGHAQSPLFREYLELAEQQEVDDAD